MLLVILNCICCTLKVSFPVLHSVQDVTAPLSLSRNVGTWVQGPKSFANDAALRRVMHCRCLLSKASIVLKKGRLDWAKTLPGPVMQELGSLNQMLIQRFLGKELQSYRFKKHLAE